MEALNPFFPSNNFKMTIKFGKNKVEQLGAGIGSISPDYFDGIEQQK